MTGLVSHRWCL